MHSMPSVTLHPNGVCVCVHACMHRGVSDLKIEFSLTRHGSDPRSEDLLSVVLAISANMDDAIIQISYRRSLRTTVVQCS